MNGNVHVARATASDIPSNVAGSLAKINLKNGANNPQPHAVRRI